MNGYAERQLEAQADQLGIGRLVLLNAHKRTRHVVRDNALNDDAKALQIVQQFLNTGWTPPGGAK